MEIQSSNDATSSSQPSPIAQSRLPEVSLVFPPLVDTNFGSYYPSTAVLAAFLSANGISSLQTDLNEAFAAYLLDTESLERMATGRFCEGDELEADSLPVVAARLLLRFRARLFDQKGRHLFQDRPNNPAYLLRALARPYRIDLPLSELVSADFQQRPIIRFYETFFDRTGYAQSIDASVQTIGISVAMGPQLAPSLILARCLKNWRADLTIILGGPTLSLIKPKDLEMLLLFNTAIDAVVRFEGEGPLLELVRQKQKGTWSPERVTGVSCRVSGAISHQPPGPGPRLDQLPYGEYDPALASCLADPELGIIQARGCYWGKCTYCDYVELYDGSPSYRTRSPEGFIDEIEFQQAKHGVRRFVIITESIPPAFARRMSELILARGLTMKWSSFAMVEKRFDADLMSLMARAGCDYLVVGLETMIDRILKKVHKSATRQDNIRFLQDAKTSGLRLRINLIPDLPSTTYREAIESLNILQGFRDCLWTVSVFPFEATSSSAIGRAPAEYGLRVLSKFEGKGQAQFALNHMDVEDPGMTESERSAIYSAYRGFADEINGRASQTSKSGFISAIDNHTYLRIAERRLDLIERNGAIYCYDWVSRQKFRLPTRWLQVLDSIRAISPFTKTDFLRLFDSSDLGKMFFAELERHNLLEPAGDERLQPSLVFPFAENSQYPSSFRG